MKTIFNAVFLLVWLAGAVLAKGFWSSLFAIFIPFWALYLVVERLMMVWGWVA
jgi:hypothetical protein